MKDDTKKDFPEGMVPIGKERFRFSCHPGVECFTICCKKVDMILYPYDVIRLKNGLQLDSEDFIRQYTYLQRGPNPYFPLVKLKMDSSSNCPFLGVDGCGIYRDRPSACRTYPLERAVGRERASKEAEEFYFMTNHEYCLGHRETEEWDVKTWVRNQKLHDYNSMNELWAEMDTLFASNPWKGEGAAGEKQQIAFMVCFNIDGFRRFCHQHGLLDRFKLERTWKRAMVVDDTEMLKFGFEWLKFFLTGRSNRLRPK